MIKVDRPACPEVLKLGLTPVSEGEKETRANLALVSRGIKLKADDYTAYKDRTVRKTLTAMFHGKCAYCESRVTVTNSGDIEHFRPKERYYWLAAEWDNLLFACAFCNRTYTHAIVDGGVSREVVLGKLSQFPLSAEMLHLDGTHGAVYFSDRPVYEAAFALEETVRLLLQPCSDQDIERFFSYNDQGVIRGADGLSDADAQRAVTSIRTYALQRLGLVREREAKVIQIKAQIRRVEIAIQNLNTYYDHSMEERTWFEGILRKEMKILLRFKDADQEYAGLARDIIGKYFVGAGLG